MNEQIDFENINQQLRKHNELEQELVTTLQNKSTFIDLLDKQTQRIERLEALVADYRAFVGELDPRYGFGAIRVGERDSLQQRADELLDHQEKRR